MITVGILSGWMGASNLDVKPYNQRAMSAKRIKKPFNPFYVLLILVGIAFCITACAYGVMTVRGLHDGAAMGANVSTTESGERLMEWLDKNGFRLMMIEIAILAVCTFSAIATDEYWTKQEAKQATGQGAEKGSGPTAISE